MSHVRFTVRPACLGISRFLSKSGTHSQGPKSVLRNSQSSSVYSKSRQRHFFAIGFTAQQSIPVHLKNASGPSVQCDTRQQPEEVLLEALQWPEMLLGFGIRVLADLQRPLKIVANVDAQYCSWIPAYMRKFM